jgi:oligoendopeptidase F
MLSDADLKFGTVTDDEGNTVELTHGRYGALLESPNRDVRKEVWHTYYDGYWKLKNTLAASYGASVKKDIFFARQRRYASAMDAKLFANHIPVAVYKQLIEAIHEALPQMHRYMAMRKKAMNLPDLQVYDLYTPMVKQVDTRVEYADAVQKVLESAHPLGADYVAAARKGFESGWVDVYEN